MLIDTHAHLHVKEFDSDRDEVINRARNSGVDFLSVGFEPRGNVAAAKLAAKYDTYYAAGIHPHHADECTIDTIDQMEDLAALHLGKGMVAVGEIGLDYFKNHQSRDVQLAAFAEQLRLAKRLGLPSIIHCRDAFEDVFEMLEREKIEQAVFHCFTGTHAVAKKAWDRGYMTSFTGIVTFSKAEPLRDLLSTAPLDRIMIESDCPFLAPQSKRGQRNEPAFIREIAELTAELRRKPFVEIDEALHKNTTSFFKLR